MQTHQIAELNLLWGALILEELARLGVKHVCMAPGSRSTPLTLAAARQQKLKQHLHFDERGLGFLALGLAKASRAPVAIITTSGTAVANLYPAIVEAWLTHVPLIVLSGDRPPELLDCGANQAIVQPAIFAGYAKQMNLPTPDIAIAPQALLSAIDDAVSNQFQPLHINCMYREPLYPNEAHTDTFTDYLAPLNDWQQDDQPWCRVATCQPSSLPADHQLQEFVRGKGVIVAGTLSPEQDPAELLALSQKLGWPLLTDAQCQLRQHPQAIGHIDQLLQEPNARALLDEADRVLVVGGRLLSKRLISYLANHKWSAYWQLLFRQERLDPSHNSKQLFTAPLAQFAGLQWPESSHRQWANALSQHNQALEQLLQQQIDLGEFGEALVIRTIARAPAHQLFIGNSLPVRMFDMFAPSAEGDTSVTYTNRGASGIDGLLATACGVAAHEDQPITLVIGDLSQLHDLNSMAIARTASGPFILVILNNDGGNIFNLLPVPNEALRSQYYRLSHGLSFEGAATMFGLPYHRPTDADEFKQTYLQALQHKGTTVIEVVVSSNQASDQIAAIGQLVRQGL
ncbi:2-succinyl-5-enolpyruvyl-6-hydroxy-3-cyclohexene-1-carboxylic-acid synthase [Shewanella corallii]|uniref:2-succinyl-5-enolpyruvyl-6-hydroxy-3-cyclohexene-1-carboxylate synthase n=1 Tax=Shewanella corallii TaxID=560080 RepID=A0ABT0N9X9_9GAMM|nr:2-succinyl-5-enolpyruvyl-6-hydroxy-3-cyclohexene-1-carboxylic-acid synthase [Shewanella corallii]MCL2915214.1 2-succinyl-5-enolpyruvyl-6-hydroxy-3-cyclohexene-1-carboxylic-acid synthase [Shewanella corallii]